jgi:cell division septum initiation protein DivIVA
MPNHLPVVRGERQVSRSLDRLQASASIEVARVRAAEAVECAKVEAIGAVSTVALFEAASLSAAEAVLAQRMPHAAGRLQHIADSGTVAMANVVTRLDRSLR